MSRVIPKSWTATAIAAVCVALGAFFTVTALGIGSHSRRVAPTPEVLTPLAIYTARTPHVLSSVVVNSEQGAISGAPATPPSDLPPLPASALDGPTRRYRSYAVDQLALMEKQITGLEGALEANDRA
jgi:hypothetical protein